MVLQLHGLNISTCTKRVATVLHEKKIPFEFHSVDFSKGEHKSPEYKTKQPFGQVPYIVDGDLILYESRAIARYLEAKAPNSGTRLIPQDLKKQALFEQAASTEQSNFDAFASPIVFEVIFKPYSNLETDKARVAELAESLKAKLDVYEQILSKQKYLAGDELTLADLFHLPYGSLLPAAGVNLIQERPHVNKWFTELTNRQSWQAVKDGVKSVTHY